jgi:hypothetical protein
MRSFVIRLSTGEYLKNIRLTSHYLHYKLTNERTHAETLNDFDSKLVLKRLEKMATREEIIQIRA